MNNSKFIDIYFLRFCLIGILCTCINYFIFYLCLVKLEASILLSGAIGFSSAIIPAYLFNRYWSFKSDISLLDGFYKYLTVNFLTLIIHLLAQWIAISLLNISALMSQFFCIFITTITNFYLVRKIVFYRLIN